MSHREKKCERGGEEDRGIEGGSPVQDKTRHCKARQEDKTGQDIAHDVSSKGVITSRQASVPVLEP